jgi:hypothetical protein
VPPMSSLPAFWLPLCRELQALPPPVVIYNKSHSGSRLLTGLMDVAGVFMGTHLNDSKDSLDVLELVTYLVCRYFPDFSPLWDDRGLSDPVLPDLVHRVFARHLEKYDRRHGSLWGWKLCETAYIVPVIDLLFPRAKFIHLLRDGRDVAFCDHRGPDNPFWRKIYFNTDKIRTWQGLKLMAKAYRGRSPVFNALHWVNSVTVGRAYGAMLRERYREVRYEDLCRSFESTAKEILRFVGLKDGADAIRTIQPSVRMDSIGKFQGHSRRELRRVMAVAKPLLLSLGYLEEDRRPASPFFGKRR